MTPWLFRVPNRRRQWACSGYGLPTRSPRFERLETRALLNAHAWWTPGPAGSTDEIDVVLVPVGTPTSADTESSLPASLAQEPVGGTFYVEVWTKDVDGSTNGITGGDLNFSFATANVSGGTINHGGIYTNLTGGTVNNSSGMVTDLSGNVNPGDNSEGVSQWVRLGYVSFTATASGTAAFTAAAGSDQFARANEGGVPWADVELNQPPASVIIGTPAPGPTASLTAAGVTAAGGTSYSFTVTYSDASAAVNVATLDSNNVTVTGPGGFSQAATFVSVNNTTNGSPRTATYQITPPGGSWATADNGTYTVSMNADQVNNVNGNFTPAGSLGTFAVAINAADEIDVVLVPVGTPTSADTESSLPASLAQEPVGGTFYVEVWTKDVDGSTNGITGGDLNFSFATANVSGGTINHGGIYTNLTGGTVNNSSGMVTDLSGNVNPGDNSEGVSQWVRLGYVSFTATASGTAAFTAAAGSDQFARANKGGVPWADVELNQPPASVIIGTPAPGPTASLTAAGVTAAGGTSYSFTVTYSDASAAVNVATLDSNNVTVTGPAASARRRPSSA